MRTLADRQREREKAEADDRDLTSRTDRRREESSRETALKRLARRLVELKAPKLQGLGLAEELLDAIQEARAIRSPNARNRQIGVVRQHLRDLGPEVAKLELALERAVGGLPGPVQMSAMRAAPSGAVPSGAVPTAVVAWAERLVGEGDTALDELLARCPELDRQQLRQCVRAATKARKAASPDAARAEQRLRQVLAASGHALPFAIASGR